MALLGAISTQLECGYLGAEAVRADRYDAYKIGLAQVNIVGAANSKRWRQNEPVSFDEYAPPAGWTEDDVLEAKNRRLDAQW